MAKTAKVKGFCPFLEEDVTIRATFTEFSELGAASYAKVLENLCEYRNDCGLDPEDECPVSTQTLLWNEL